MEDNLTKPNEYSKSYQIYRNVHIPDPFNRFKDPAGARRRLDISWNKLSEAEESHLESMAEKN